MEHTPDPDRLTRHEALFAAVMQMEEDDLIQRVRSAPKENLPAEVLARAYRELWLAERFVPAEAVANRLLGARTQDSAEGVGAPEYMRWLLIAAEKFVSPKSAWREAADLYQGALRQIIRALRGKKGAQAHTAWKGFCMHRLSDARRERTRKDPRVVGLEAEDPSSGELVNLGDTAEESPWQGSTAPDREEELTAFLRARLVEAVKDPRVLEIGLDQFFGDPSPIDVVDPERPDRVPLTEQFGLNRFQIYRLAKKAQVVLRRAAEEWTERDSRP
jgi:hypothetical protein